MVYDWSDSLTMFCAYACSITDGLGSFFQTEYYRKSGASIFDPTVYF